MWIGWWGVMNRRISVVLLVLLVTSSGLAAWQYSENQRLATENTQLKNELDKVSSKLADADAERMNLEHELNQTGQQLNAMETQVTELQVKIQQLEENVTALRQQLQDKAMQKGSITVGLTFLWNPTLADVSATRLSQIVQYMNRHEWAPFRIYFLLAHAQPESFIPTTETCLPGFGHTWGSRALSLYPQKDIPIAIVATFPSASGCADPSVGIIAVTQSIGIIPVIRYQDDELQPAILLTHELLHLEHLGGISDDELYLAGINSGYRIPIEWFERIRSHAQWFAWFY